MSYRIAFVRFKSGGHSYPINCFRADIAVGDQVVVHLPSLSTKIQHGEVTDVHLLNWNCSNHIIGLSSEVSLGPNWSYIVKRRPRKDGHYDTLGDVADRLVSNGWEKFYPVSRVWKIVYRCTKDHRAAIIAFRKNGIDFQIIQNPKPILGRKISIMSGDGELIRHDYYQSGVDLYRFSVDFADAFEQGEANLRFFMTCQPWERTKPSIPKNAERDDLKDIRNAVTSGMGGPAYLCDGVWV